MHAQHPTPDPKIAPPAQPVEPKIAPPPDQPITPPSEPQQPPGTPPGGNPPVEQPTYPQTDKPKIGF
jgi:hypothetical protein